MTYDNIITSLFPQGEPDNFKDYALIIPASTAEKIEALQTAIASDKHRISPVATIDNRWLLSADILPELNESGLFKRAIPYLQPSIFEGIEIMAWHEALDLLPQPSEELL